MKTGHARTVVIFVVIIATLITAPPTGALNPGYPKLPPRFNGEPCHLQCKEEALIRATRAWEEAERMQEELCGEFEKGLKEGNGTQCRSHLASEVRELAEVKIVWEQEVANEKVIEAEMEGREKAEREATIIRNEAEEASQKSEVEAQEAHRTAELAALAASEHAKEQAKGRRIKAHKARLQADLKALKVCERRYVGPRFRSGGSAWLTKCDEQESRYWREVATGTRPERERASRECQKVLGSQSDRELLNHPQCKQN
jgi:hypothetical protein